MKPLKEIKDLLAYDPYQHQIEEGVGKNYELAVKMLGKMLDDHTKDGKLTKSLEHLADKVASQVKGVNLKSLIDTYKKTMTEATV